MQALGQKSNPNQIHHLKFIAQYVHIKRLENWLTYPHCSKENIYRNIFFRMVYSSNDSGF